MVRSHTLALLLVVLAQSTSESLAESSQRTVWTTSRFIGSPDPPKPFTVELAFPHLELPNLVYLEREPAADTFLLVQHIVNWNGPTRILRVRPAGSAEDAELLLELRQLVYSLAFHPDFEKNGFLYFFGNGRDASGARTNEILRYTMDRDSGAIVEGSARLIIAWPSSGHDGGGIAFDKSGLMYLSAGDGSATSDENDTGQRLDDLPGSILRIDVDHVQANQTYSIPADNPFVGQENVRPEIYAYGLRNPWRLTYDTVSDQLWTGINGQDLWESAQLVRKGENYGWPIMEANHPFQLERQIGPSPIVRNTVEHPHSEARSLTGGFVYRGEVWPELQGAYLYGDYETGNIWAVKHDGQQVVWQRQLAATRIKITCFTPGLNGEILVVDHQGRIYRLIANTQTESGAVFPMKLSESGLFDDLQSLQPQPGVWSYQIQASRWADGATAVRHVGIPGGEQARPKPNKAWMLPEASVLAKTYSLPVWDEVTKVTRLRKVETQVLTKQAGEWAGYSYRWNAEQTDAELVPAEGATSEWMVQQRNRVEPIRWRFHSRNECIVCHNREIEYVIGFTTNQLDRSIQFNDTTMSQLQYFQDIGLTADIAAADQDDARRLIDPYHEDGDLAQRARSYLHVNCRPCHAREAGGNATIDLDIGSNTERMKLFGERPMHGDFGLRNAALVVPGHPERSVLYYRLAKLGPGRMPYAGSSSSDVDGIKLIYDWVQSLPVTVADATSTQMVEGTVDRAVDETLGELLRVQSETPDSDEWRRLVESLCGETSSAVALQHAVDVGMFSSNATHDIVRHASATGTSLAQDLFERFLPPEMRKKRIGGSIGFGEIAALHGDAVRGRQLFELSDGLQCRSCHSVERNIDSIGPNLANIGSRFRPEEILLAIVRPSVQINSNYVTRQIVTRDGRSLSGVVRQIDDTKIQVQVSSGAVNELNRVDIESNSASNLSTMPEGQLNALTAQDVADLIQFLSRLR